MLSFKEQSFCQWKDYNIKFEREMPVCAKKKSKLGFALWGKKKFI